MDNNKKAVAVKKKVCQPILSIKYVNSLRMKASIVSAISLTEQSAITCKNPWKQVYSKIFGMSKNFLIVNSVCNELYNSFLDSKIFVERKTDNFCCVVVVYFIRLSSYKRKSCFFNFFSVLSVHTRRHT